MDARGLCVKGLDVPAISKKLEKYVADYFTGYKLGEGQSLFQESHLFWLEEISGLLPEHYFQRFTDMDKFLCSCGFFEVDNTQDNASERVRNRSKIT